MLDKISAVVGRYYNRWLGLIKRPNILNVDETIRLLQQGYSISRFGDGEFYLVGGTDIAFQPATPELLKELKAILRGGEPRLLVGIPSTLVSLAGLREKPAGYWRNYYLESRRRIYSFLNFRHQYADSLITRLYIDYTDKGPARRRFEEIKKIWQGRSLMIVEGENSRLGIGNDFFDGAATVKRIIGPAKNAFERRNEIVNEVNRSAQKTDIVILALGPAATVLASDLHQLGFQALDLGHIDIEYEWMLMGAQEKVPVKYKNMWEVKNGEVKDDNFADEAYFKSIVAKIL